MNKLKRYLLFLIGLFINALGVSLVTKASLGTSPISSIPYVLSLKFPPTLGNFTIIFSILLILLQILILRKNFKIENILQIPVSIAFGYFIDLTMYLFFWVNPGNYAMSWLPFWQAASCLDLRYTATTKIIFDSSMTVIAGILSFIFWGKLNGVREGTIIAALLVGFIARLFGKHLEFMRKFIIDDIEECVEEALN